MISKTLHENHLSDQDCLQNDIGLKELGFSDLLSFGPLIFVLDILVFESYLKQFGCFTEIFNFCLETLQHSALPEANQKYDLESTIFHQNLKVELLFLLLHSLVVALASLQGHGVLEQLLSILRHQDNLVLGVLRPLLPGCQPTIEDDRPASMSVMSALYLR